MRTEDYDFYLEESRIAQHPIDKRDKSKLLVLRRDTGDIEHKRFYDIKSILRPGDVLVINDTKVIPARLFGHRKDKTETIEVLMLKRVEKDLWEALVRPGKKMKMGSVVYFGNGELSCEVKGITDDGTRLVEFVYEGIFEERLDELGEMPLPPYIKEKLQEKDRYQTVYAKQDGSAAAPTAGLHFTPELIKEIEDMGVKIVNVTLHVGLGTFRPVSVEDVSEHKMHSEYFNLPKTTCDAINDAKKNGRRIISVGTTTTRTLESAIRGKEVLEPMSGNTDIFIYPGFEFKVIDGLITNFHLPKSTLLMLVSAFSTKERVFKAYEEAIKNEYRFFSFGDAMLII
ncbi:tRNA preQ1(34) S-adenosylmethionine ribosyltransferase-isomerase QueA [Microaceticoccus formicicus]|uniref:tRNA preQ1(34) S-adenosylmethionine ribosyltransferase-isomerase QueA n=1 Tax=Microaceticoccus formicicus TaxID=3118105 RepID=UPI003CD01B5B|nr:tRNA preQ1(34) S-adenosylmethionine ribosyltransferase-isomerase QueA [Peptoniphilaceae bacterium AMB_02]